MFGLSFSDGQILITGTYRTGSEFLTHVLNCHPSLSATMYRVNLFRFIYRKYEPITDKSNQLRSLRDTADRLYERYKITLPVDRIMDSFSLIRNLRYADWYDIVMSQLYLSANPDLTHWAEKCQLVWREIPEFLGMFPQGKCVHIIRDPRAVLHSFKNYTNQPSPAYLGAVYNCYDSMRFATIYNEIYGDRVKVIRYEDLLGDPLAVAQLVWEFLGLSAVDSIRYDGWTDAYGEPWYNNSSFYGNNADDHFSREKALYGWKESLTEQEINFVSSICSVEMDRWGYDSGTFDFLPSSLIENMIFDSPQLRRAMHLMNRYGIGIQEFPASPTDPSTWEKR